MVICAAIKITYPDKTCIVIPGWRHHNCYWILGQLNPELSKNVRFNGCIEEGFINHINQFLSREEAYKEALVCGQLSAALRQYKTERNENILFSEDLY